MNHFHYISFIILFHSSFYFIHHSISFIIPFHSSFYFIHHSISFIILFHSSFYYIHHSISFIILFHSSFYFIHHSILISFRPTVQLYRSARCSFRFYLVHHHLDFSANESALYSPNALNLPSKLQFDTIAFSLL